MLSDRNVAILILLLFPLSAYCSATQNNVTSVPSSHNSSLSNALPGNQVVCTPTNWYDIAWFYFANYVMHALSVRSLPGENSFTSIAFKLACLLIPYTGIRRGLCLVARASNWVRHDLQAAARANALCMVIRGDNWRPRNEDEIQGCVVEKSAGPISRIEEVQTSGSSSGSSSNEKEKDVQRVDQAAAEEEKPIKRSKTEPFKIYTKIKSTTTASTTFSNLSAEEAASSIAFKLRDCYDPPADRNFLDTLYRWFIETYKFGSTSLSNSIRLDPDFVKIHGLCTLAPGYQLVYVPADIKVSPRAPEAPRPNLFASIRRKNIHEVVRSLRSQTRISSSQNAPRILFSIFQVVSGGWSLYRAQGVQIDKFGFAAYGLTVLPYMIVSMFNFAGSLLTKEYDMVYLVHSSIMDEMVSRGGSVDGVIGTVDPQPDNDHAPAGPYADPPTMSTTQNPHSKEELLSPTGSTVEFRCDPSLNTMNTTPDPENAATDTRESSISYRDPSLSSTWSPALTFAKGVLPSQSRSYHTAAWRTCGEWRDWYRQKYKGVAPPSPPQGLTIIHIPCHGPLVRLPPPFYEGFLRALTLALLIAALAVPIIVITVLTGWQPKQSLPMHRNFVVQWILAGMLLGYGAGAIENLAGNNTMVLKGFGIVFVSYGTYCISGFVAVAQEMRILGTCTAL